MDFDPSFELKIYTPDQLNALINFKQTINLNEFNELRYMDRDLLRFLRARKFDVPKSNQMWTNFIKWRKEMNIIYPFDYPEKNEVKKHFPHTFFGIDKKGRPIYIERLGQININEISKITTDDRLVRYYMSNLERLISIWIPIKKCKNKTI